MKKQGITPMSLTPHTLEPLSIGVSVITEETPSQRVDSSANVRVDSSANIRVVRIPVDG